MSCCLLLTFSIFWMNGIFQFAPFCIVVSSICPNVLLTPVYPVGIITSEFPTPNTIRPTSTTTTKPFGNFAFSFPFSSISYCFIEYPAMMPPKKSTIPMIVKMILISFSFSICIATSGSRHGHAVNIPFLFAPLHSAALHPPVYLGVASLPRKVPDCHAWTIRDSNPRPSGYEPDALTN